MGYPSISLRQNQVRIESCSNKLGSDRVAKSLPHVFARQSWLTYVILACSVRMGGNLGAFPDFEIASIPVEPLQQHPDGHSRWTKTTDLFLLDEDLGGVLITSYRAFLACCAASSFPYPQISERLLFACLQARGVAMLGAGTGGLLCCLPAIPNGRHVYERNSFCI